MTERFHGRITVREIMTTSVLANSQRRPNSEMCTSRRVSFSHTTRTSDSAYVRFLTESAILSRRILHCNGIWSDFPCHHMMRYRRPPQVWVREWNLWALREHFPHSNFPSCEGEAMFRHHLVNLRGHERQNLDREGRAFLDLSALTYRYEQVLKSYHG